MSKRPQVLLDEQEYQALGELAGRQGMTVSEWVRQAIRAARKRESGADPTRKLAALRGAVRHSFPTADIGQMLSETARGMLCTLP